MMYVPLLVDAKCLLDRLIGAYMIEQDDGPVLDHLTIQHMPQLWNREGTVRIQLLQDSLPGHEHRLQIEKLERQLVNLTETVGVIR